MYSKIIDCTIMGSDKMGYTQLVAEFSNGSIESIGTFTECESKVESIIPSIIGCTYGQAKRVIESRGI